jgi:DNA ligase 1
MFVPRKFLEGKQNGNLARSKQTAAASSVKTVPKAESKGDNVTAEDAVIKRSLPNGTPKKSSPAVATNEVPDSNSPKREKTSGADGEDDSDEQPVVKRRKTSSKHTSSSSKSADHKTSGDCHQDSRTGGKAPETSTEPMQKKARVDSEERFSEDEESSDIEMNDEPAKSTKKHDQIQAVVQGSIQNPYPDWKAGEPVPYAALCTTFSLVEMTTKRLEISAHSSRFLQQVLRLTPEDVLSTVQLMINKVAADYAGIELGIGESLIIKAISESTGRSLAETKADHHKIGDLGLVAAKSRSNQRTMFKPKALTVKRVHEGLLAIASLQGHGAQDRKVSSIMKLLSSADAGAPKGAKGIDIICNKGGASESKFLIRFLEGKLRLGLAERTVIVALAQAMVKHEAAQKGNKIPSSEQMAEGEAILKTVYRYERALPANISPI